MFVIPHVEQITQPPNRYADAELPPQKFIPYLSCCHDKLFKKKSLDTLWVETLRSCSTGKSCENIRSLYIFNEVRTKTF